MATVVTDLIHIKILTKQLTKSIINKCIKIVYCYFIENGS